jgi:hypothetical protein
MGVGQRRRSPALALLVPGVEDSVSLVEVILAAR